MEIGRAAGETAQDRSFEAVEITAFAGDQRSARIARVEGLGLPGVERVGATGDQKHRQLWSAQLSHSRPDRRIRLEAGIGAVSRTDVEWQRKRVIARVGRGVAARAALG